MSESLYEKINDCEYNALAITDEDVKNTIRDICEIIKSILNESKMQEE